MDLILPSADTVVHNSLVLFANQCVMSSNRIVIIIIITITIDRFV